MQGTRRRDKPSCPLPSPRLHWQLLLQPRWEQEINSHRLKRKEPWQKASQDHICSGCHLNFYAEIIYKPLLYLIKPKPNTQISPDWQRDAISLYKISTSMEGNTNLIWYTGEPMWEYNLDFESVAWGVEKVVGTRGGGTGRWPGKRHSPHPIGLLRRITCSRRKQELYFSFKESFIVRFTSACD